VAILSKTAAVSSGKYRAKVVLITGENQLQSILQQKIGKETWIARVTTDFA